jgi:hypothetical protein
MNDELKRIWNEEIAAESRCYDGIFPEGLRKARHDFIQDSWLPGRSSNRVPPDYKFRVLSLDQWYSTSFVRVPPDIISLQLCTPKVVGV